MNVPRFTIITPTLQRKSLITCCDSVTRQTFKSWQHIVIADVEQFDLELMRGLNHPQRRIVKCASPHRNFGNTCRHNAWEMAEGNYLVMVDDDNFLSDENILADIAIALKDSPPFGVFPILRHGQRFYSDPPRCCHADTANIVVQRDIGRWPNIPDYTADGIWIDALVKDHPTYQTFPDFRPIVIMPVSSEGR